MSVREGMIKEVENTLVFLENKVKNGENFESSSTKEELERVRKMHRELLWYFSEY